MQPAATGLANSRLADCISLGFFCAYFLDYTGKRQCEAGGNTHDYMDHCFVSAAWRSLNHNH
jgi:hypothetical protein